MSVLRGPSLGDASERAAQTLSREITVTLARTLKLPLNEPAGLGLGTRFHLAPFQCNTSVLVPVQHQRLVVGPATGPDRPDLSGRVGGHIQENTAGDGGTKLLPLFAVPVH